MNDQKNIGDISSGCLKDVLLFVEGRCGLASLCNSLPCIQSDKGKCCGLADYCSTCDRAEAHRHVPKYFAYEYRKTPEEQIVEISGHGCRPWMSASSVNVHKSSEESPYPAGHKSKVNVCAAFRTIVLSIKPPSPCPLSASQQHL